MGDAADDAADMAEEMYFEYLGAQGRATKLTDVELVEQVESIRDDPVDYFVQLDESQTSMAIGISEWYRDKGFLTVKQRGAMINIVATLWTE